MSDICRDGLRRALCVEVRECFGGRAVTLESQVRANPGLIDVYSPGTECPGDPLRGRYSRFGAAAYMLIDALEIEESCWVMARPYFSVLALSCGLYVNAFLWPI